MNWWWKAVLSIGVAIVLGIAVNDIASRFAQDPSMRAVSTATGTVRGLDLQMHGVVRKNVVRAGESVLAQLTLTNTSDTQLTDLRLTWVPNGFRLRQRLSFRGTMLPRATQQMVFSISPTETRGEFSPAIVAWWKDGAGNEHSRVLGFGPLRVQNVWQTRTIWLARMLQLTVKDLGLPLVLAFLGFWFKKKEDERAKADRDAADERAKQDRKAAEDRAAKDRNAAEQRASRQQVFSILLPESHGDARKYYLPMQAAADMIPLVYRRYKLHQKNASAAEELYYHLIVFVRRMRHIQLNIGGFHFLSLAGEDILASSWAGFKRHLDQSASKERISEVLDLIEDPMLGLAAFNALVKKLAPINDVKKSVLDWIRKQPEKFEEALLYLQLFQLVLAFELNRVYELWYGRPLEFKFADWDTLIAQLANLQYFSDEIREYADRYRQERQDAADAA